MAELNGCVTCHTRTRGGRYSHSRPGPPYTPKLLVLGSQSSVVGNCAPWLFFCPYRWLQDPEDDAYGPRLWGRWGTSLGRFRIFFLDPPLEQKIKQDTGKI